MYRVLEYDPLLDSTNMTYDDYVHLANDIYVCTTVVEFVCRELSASLL